MDARLDTAFESWGQFSEGTWGPSVINGRLCYDPVDGLKLELLGAPTGTDPFVQVSRSSTTFFGRLVDGTPVTLADCFITKSSSGAGGIGLPTSFRVNRAVFGDYVADVNDLKVASHTVELSSLSNWTCVCPVNLNTATEDSKLLGVNICFRRPDPIHVPLPNRSFDLQISHGSKISQTDSSASVRWHAGVTIRAHEAIAFRDAIHVGWQCQNLMALLIGCKLSVRSATITPLDEEPSAQKKSPLQLVYHQRGSYDEPDAHPSQMLLPYDSIRDSFPRIVEKWFARSEQAVLAANVLFGAQLLESPAVNVRFLAVVQAAESYHRALGTGVYMDQAEYDKAIEQLDLPDCIRDDHRTSLENRLKYGNEYSLRKRLTNMFERLPEDVRLRIAGDVAKFVGKVVDTRNYYTHYDHAARLGAFDGQGAFVAAERLRVIVVASLLHDLGIEDHELLSVLERSGEFRHWMSRHLLL